MIFVSQERLTQLHSGLTIGVQNDEVTGVVKTGHGILREERIVNFRDVSVAPMSQTCM